MPEHCRELDDQVNGADGDRYAHSSSIVRDTQQRAETDMEHWAILDAARRADVDAAIEQMLQHIQAPLEHVEVGT